VSDEVRWAPRVPPHRIRRLYQTDARGIVDDEQIDDVGYALHARCQSILRATAAHAGDVTCPRCGGTVPRPGPVQRRGQALRCAACSWATTWGAYADTYRGKHLTGGSALDAFREFVERFPTAATSRARMLAIDRLLNAFHHELKRPTRPAGINLIEGSLADVLAFLEELSAGPEAAGRTGAERARRAAALAGARLGNRLRLLRRAAGLTGKQLGARVGMSQSRVSEVETGRRPPSAAEVERLADALGASAELRTTLVVDASSLRVQYDGLP
jgi:DNA-binding XRE family transcriptional regulator